MSKAADQALEKYANSSVARAGMNLLSPIGSAMDAFISSEFSRRQQERNIELIQEVDLRVASVEESLVDSEFVRSDEFQTLFVRAFLSMRTTHTRDKFIAFANVLASCALKSGSEDSQKERYLLLLDELTDVHLAILGCFRKRELELKDGSMRAALRASDVASRVGLSPEEVEVFCADLVARGLLYDPLVGTYNYERGAFQLHPSSRRLFEYLFSEWPEMP